MKKLLLAALCATAPAFANPTAHPHGSAALPPGPCRGVETIQCHKQNPSRADFTFTLTQCTDKAHGTEATAWRPGLTDKSVPDHTWKKVAEHHDAKRMGAPAEYKAPGFDLSVNWTTAPQAPRPHQGHRLGPASRRAGRLHAAGRAPRAAPPGAAPRRSARPRQRRAAGVI